MPRRPFVFLLPARRSLDAGGEEKIRRAQKHGERFRVFACLSADFSVAVWNPYFKNSERLGLKTGR